MSKATMVKSFFETIGDPNKWEFTGQVNDNKYMTDVCVCGHFIRYEYIIRNIDTGETEKVGSECITNFKEYNEALYNELVTAKRELEEERKRKLQETRDSKYRKEYENNLAEAKAIRDELYEKYTHLGAPKVKVPYILWKAINAKDCIKTECDVKYKTWRGYKQWSEKNLGIAKTYKLACDEIKLTEDNKYVEPGFDGKIWFGKHSGKELKDVPTGYLQWIQMNFEGNTKKINEFISSVNEELIVNRGVK